MIESCRNQPYVITIANSTNITSPNHPFNYDNNLDCTWLIVATKGNRIKLSISGEVEDR